MCEGHPFFAHGTGGLRLIHFSCAYLLPVIYQCHYLIYKKYSYTGQDEVHTSSRSHRLYVIHIPIHLSPGYVVQFDSARMQGNKKGHRIDLFLTR